ncbi:hypothetical protein QPJ95_05405 [Parasedimentitalea psychrophila]|uniref:Uncharacterized protein n=2 Tax=Parasedimentitalea psychrophila TaxID=2997337 RepID=A0A9Y2L407_9RHOB|nr:hypothetical protein QPJ95_05405 [Parasedimentitalea psychrophila]
MATAHIPGFLPGADGSDPLFTGMVVFTILLVMVIGSFYFKLHAIPEHMAHADNHAQMQVIGILALLALFTHNNMFWVLALLVAAFRMPDFLTPLQSIAGSLDSLNKREQAAVELDSSAAPSQQPAPQQPSQEQPQTQPQTQPQGDTHA